jgi:hypothetical protein
MILPILSLIALGPSRLNVGTTWSGDQTLHFVSKEAEIDETHRFRLSFRVTGREDEMWIVDRKSILVNTNIDGTDIPGPPNQEPATVKEWLAPAGFLLDATPFDKGGFALDRLLHFWLPANLPDEWSADLSTTLDHYVGKAKAEFKRASRADGSTRDYTLTFSAYNDLTAKGRMWFDVKTGRLLRAKIDATRAMLPGGSERANVTLTYVDSHIAKPLD